MGRLWSLLRRLSEPRLRRRVLVVVACAGLTSLPLVGSLGYENAFVLAPVFSLLAMAVGVDQIRTSRSAGEPRSDLLQLAGAGLGELATLHGLALAALFVGRLWQKGCDPLGGLLFYAMGPVASSLLGWACGIWGGVFAQRRWRQLALALAPALASLAIGLWRLFAHPVVFAYDPFWGYFSGSLYDESISVGSRYLWYRAYNVVALLGLLGAWGLLVDHRTLAPRRPPVSRATAALAVLTMSAAAITLTAGLSATRHGWTANADSITKVLSATKETEHFVIHYVPRSQDARWIETMAIEHEFAWKQLSDEMGREPEVKVHSFIFENAGQKRALLGAGKVQVAAPWRYQIYLDHRGFPHRVLHHELAHVFGATIGDSLLGVSRSGLKLNIGLIEGLATALAPRSSGHLDLHDQAKILGELKRRPPIARIMGPGFFGLSSRVAYTTAGSFCRWLIDTRGFDPMAVLYRTAGDFEAAYGEPLSGLEQEWLAFLDGYEGITPEDVEEQRQRFQRRAVWQRPCAHKVAEVAKEIGKASQQGKLDEAIEHHRQLCELEPENPAHQLGLAKGLADAELYDEALGVLARTENSPALTVSIRSALLEDRGDVELAAGRLGAASASYKAALDLPNAENKRRVLALKRLGAADPALAPHLLRYFALFDVEGDALTQALGRIHESTQIAEMNRYEALGKYLWARQLLNIQWPQPATPLLEASLVDDGADHRSGPADAGTSGLPNADFVRAARLALMQAYTLTGRFDDARDVLEVLEAQPSVPNGHRLIHDQWRARLEFFGTYAATSRE